MSEDLDAEKPSADFNPGSTQPLKPVKRSRRWSSIIVSVLGVIVLLALGTWGGYASGLGERKAARDSVISKQLMEQFQFALVDEKFGHYDAAQERLQFIIQNDPTFPGAQAELAKVLVFQSIPTATATSSPTPTPDLRGEQSLFATAQQLIAAGDWANALSTLDQLRKRDPNFNTSQVDGMYYFGLRNYGVSLIQQKGDLEGGIYQLTLAERFAPLDNSSSQLREGARAYIKAASYFGINWASAVELFRTVAGGWPAMWDGSMNANQRFQIALMRYGDQLWGQGQACPASEQYQEAQTIGQLDATAAKNANQAFHQCYPPTEAPTAPVTDTPGPGPLPTDTPLGG